MTTSSTPAVGKKQVEALMQELAAVYRDADALFSGWTCPCSTECCRFGITGLEPYVTSIEFVVLKRALDARGGEIKANRRALPLADAKTRRVTNERICPMLDAQGHCIVYEHRPLGCRTYFCSKATESQRVGHVAMMDLVRRIEQIAARHTPGGDEPHRLGKLLGV